MEFGRGLQLLSSLVIGVLVGGTVTYFFGDVAGVMIGVCAVFLAVKNLKRLTEG